MMHGNSNIKFKGLNVQQDVSTNGALSSWEGDSPDLSRIKKSPRRYGPRSKPVEYNLRYYIFLPKDPSS